MPTETALRQAVAKAVTDAHDVNPLVSSITNVITIDFVANAQLACGGSAAMVYLAEEGQVLAQASQAMYLNIGSLLPVHEEGFATTARALHEAGTPWVLDPVGIGIGSLRTKLLLACKDCAPAVIRCNASEAIALAELWGLDTAGQESGVRGVDATDTIDEARAAAIALARHTGGAVAISGVVDLVTDGKQVALVQGGSEYMTKITGCGCSLGGVTAVYAAVADPFTAALTGTAIYDLAGVRASLDAQGPASFKVKLIDALYNAEGIDVANVPFVLEEA